MTRPFLAPTTLVTTLLLLAPALPVAAQAVGTFRWQLQPYCNVVTVNVIQQGAVYTVDGYDDQCGAPQRAPLTGLATPNPDGTVGIGLSIVTVPGGRGVQVDARVSLPSGSGAWSDSAGNSGTFVLGGAGGGAPRPTPTIPASMIAPGSITGAQLAPGTITATHLAAGSVGTGQINTGQVQARVSGVCANGQSLRGVNPDGTVVCNHAITTVDAPVPGLPFPNVGSYSSLAIGTDGLPVVSHAGHSGLRVTHCGNAACSSGSISTNVDTPFGGVVVGFYSSIAIGADGLPLISHVRGIPRDLRVTHCTRVDCNGGTAVVVDPGIMVGHNTSLAVGADGLPVISYQDFATQALRVTHCGNPQCTSGNVSTTIDDPGTNAVGTHASLAIGADGLPVISHHDAGVNGLRVTHCGNASCTAGNVSTTVDDPLSGAGLYASIAIGADGLAIISHRGNEGLRVTHCGNTTCTSSAVSTNVPGTDFVANYTSIAVGADGLPVISHSGTNSFGPSALYVTHCGNAACTGGTVSTALDDPTNSVGAYTSIAIGVDGLPVVSYFDATALSLRVATCGTRTCQ